jgi:hypothetical protein
MLITSSLVYPVFGSFCSYFIAEMSRHLLSGLDTTERATGSGATAGVKVSRSQRGISRDTRGNESWTRENGLWMQKTETRS